MSFFYAVFNLRKLLYIIVWNHAKKLREQYAAELKKVAQLQKQWALRKPVLDAHCLTLQKEIQRLEQEIDGIVMEKIQTGN